MIRNKEKSMVRLLHSVLAAVREDIILYIFLCLVDSEVAFAKDISVEVE